MILQTYLDSIDVVIDIVFYLRWLARRVSLLRLLAGGCSLGVLFADCDVKQEHSGCVLISSVSNTDREL